MNFIRQNTPFVLKWDIELQGTAIKLADTKVSVIASCARGRIDLTDYIDSIEENTITIKQNKGLAFIGDYSLMAIIESENLTTLKVQEKYVFRAIAKNDPTETESLVSIRSSIVASGGYDSALSEVSQNAIQNAPVAKEFGKVYQAIEDTESLIKQSVEDVLGGASEAYDTLKEIEDYIEKDEAGAVALTQSIARLETEKVSKEDIDSALSTESENPVQNKVITAELSSLGDSLSSLEDSKADKDGVYSGMTVGRSIDLLGVEDVEEGSFLFRPTDGDGSIKDGVAVVKSVKGNSVVWNQKFEHRNYTSNGITITYQDGKYHSVGQLSQTYFNMGQFTANELNHKYLFVVDGLSSSFNGTFALLNRVGKAQPINGFAFIFMDNIDPSKGRYIGLDGMNIGDEIDETYTLVQYDLTQMFGAGNEPTTIEEFNARTATLCIEDTNAYNAGEVVNMKASAIKSVGFNAWDEEWENGSFNVANGTNVQGNWAIRNKNYIKVLPKQTYYFKMPTSYRFVFYDEQKNYISGEGKSTNQAITTPSNCHYLRFSVGTSVNPIATYNHDICINLVHSGYRNGEYEPYVEDVLALPTLDLFPNGMNKIGDVYDEYDEEKSVQRIGIRPYQSGDESIENVLTDGTSTFYVLEEPIVTPHKQRLAYKAWDFGTEQVIADGNTTAITAGITYEFNARDTIRSNKTRLDVLEPIVAGKIDKEADDYYPQLAVGLADNLSGVDVVDSEVNFRRSGGGAISDGVARIEAIKGNSAVWNQHYQPVATVIGTRTTNGVTFTVSEDGTIQAEGTAEGGSAYITLMQYTNFLASHKYILIAIGAPIGAWNNQGFYFTGVSGMNTSSMIGAEGYKIFQPSADGASGLNFTAWNGYSLSCRFRPIFCDLTKAFPNDWQNINTIEDFYARIPMGVDLNAYNEGEVIHMDVQSIESQGVNAWDEEWELGTYQTSNGKPSDSSIIRCKNAIAVLPNMTYHFNIPIPSSLTDKSYMGYALFYNDKDEYINYVPVGGNYYTQCLTPTNARYMRFYLRVEYGLTYNHDICINISDTSINGKYFPYIKRVEDLAVIRKYFPNGMKSAGTAHDEIRYNKESGKWEYSKGKIKSVDLGTLAWTQDQLDTARFRTLATTWKATFTNNLLCEKYATAPTQDILMPDKSIAMTNSQISPLFRVKDSAYTDAASFKAAMQGVIVYYESTEWEWVELDAEDQFKDLDYQVWNCGTEKAIAEGKSAPLAADITYGFNAIGKIKELEQLIKTLTTQVASLTNK